MDSNHFINIEDAVVFGGVNEITFVMSYRF